MTRCYIIQKAIAKAQENGFEPLEGKHKLFLDTDGDIVVGHETFILDPAFAKAFWGEEMGCSLCHEPKMEAHGCMDELKPRWEYCLQEISTSTDPFAYLEKYL